MKYGLFTRAAFFGVAALLAGSVSELRAEDMSALIAQGKYVAEASDCSACHTVRGRGEFAGGMEFKLPIGSLYSSNITPDPTHGIGAYSEAEFSRAVREGVRRDGASLYPAMPFPSYARMSDGDLHALYVYFMKGVQPVALAVPPNSIPWPLSIRLPMTIWRAVFSPSVVAAQKDVNRPLRDDEIERGAYLVEGPGHCGACHSPRGMALQEKALSNSNGSLFLSGGAAIDGFVPTSLRQDQRTGLAGWSEDDIVQFLATGRNRRGEAFGGMTDAIFHGTQHLTDADLHAMARYLLSLQPHQPTLSAWHYDPSAANALQAGDASAQGAKVYVDHCEACHRSDGRGYAPAFPPLAGNPVLMSADPASLVHVVQSGAVLPGMTKAPSAFAMPAYSGILSSQQIADVVTFIRKAWGNNAAPVTAAMVEELRKSAPESAIKKGIIPLN
ncbi:c-type cytochrome [Gluconobacter sphaericus]|uniref:Cytochrome c n=1 Tax=Gluconobacter sphaericus NBRC 12467 TaxID=1307951 RepID=A0AA37SHG8_9PROT|nr:cytochrome c [Gluconobacter sphaericus]MBF0886556.1 c-type cytochrome [Gluconobacter sphaericus]MBS1086778.1 c-type cytochrome [Gluconobacter sphaericus]MBS1100671.1 c-type cytochrome [Gluconobacter sphaericus]GBR54843.1 gluconate 2-dehydrogenase, cytochrome c subunit [Gluconobacter sphaericus NBRC 12467]GEB43466.1 cytochrome c [Gluconobacter sphaericus NBRC 12467]